MLIVFPLLALSSTAGSAQTNLPFALSETGHTNDVSDVAVSDDGRFVATASYDNTVHIWSIGKKNLSKKAIVNCPEGLWKIAFSHSDEPVLLIVADTGFTVCNPSSGEMWSFETDDTGTEILSAAFSPCGGYVIATTSDGTATIHTVEGESVLKDGGYNFGKECWRYAKACDLNTELGTVAIASSNSVTVLNGRDRKEIKTPFHPAFIAFLSSGTKRNHYLVAVSRQGDVTLIDTTGRGACGRQVVSISARTPSVRFLSFIDNTLTLITGNATSPQLKHHTFTITMDADGVPILKHSNKTSSELFTYTSSFHSDSGSNSTSLAHGTSGGVSLSNNGSECVSFKLPGRPPKTTPAAWSSTAGLVAGHYIDRTLKTSHLALWHCTPSQLLEPYNSLNKNIR